MENIETWVRSVQELLYRLKDLDFGYPLGPNELLPPQDTDTVENGLLLAQASNLSNLKEFYSNCDGVVLPDIHVGYFIKSVTKLGIVDPSSEPFEVSGRFTGTVLCFGSTGGGGLFVLRKITYEVLHFAPGPLDNGMYDGDRGRVKLVAPTFDGFLDCLAADIRAFVNNETCHRFMC